MNFFTGVRLLVSEEYQSNIAPVPFIVFLFQNQKRRFVIQVRNAFKNVIRVAAFFGRNHFFRQTSSGLYRTLLNRSFNPGLTCLRVKPHYPALTPEFQSGYFPLYKVMPILVQIYSSSELPGSLFFGDQRVTDRQIVIRHQGGIRVDFQG
jgi:hypothetical protein